MRVFYIDENKNEHVLTKRTYYVKMDNVIVPDILKGYKKMEASTPQDLLEIVKMYYGLNNCSNICVQLWSSRIYNGVRLDTMNEIPNMYEFIWVRIILNNNKS